MLGGVRLYCGRLLQYWQNPTSLLWALEWQHLLDTLHCHLHDIFRYTSAGGLGQESTAARIQEHMKLSMLRIVWRRSSHRVTLHFSAWDRKFDKPQTAKRTAAVSIGVSDLPTLYETPRVVFACNCCEPFQPLLC